MKQWSEVYESLRRLWRLYWLSPNEEVKAAICHVSNEITGRDQKIRELEKEVMELKMELNHLRVATYKFRQGSIEKS